MAYIASGITAAATNAVTVTLSVGLIATDVRVFEVFGLNGLDTAATGSGYHVATGSSTTCTDSLTTSNAMDFLMSFCYLANAVTTINSPFLNFAGMPEPNGNTALGGTVTSAGTYTPTANLSAGAWNDVSLIFKAFWPRQTLTVSGGVVNTYYVDLAGGNDSNNGTAAATPWLTLSHADATISLATNGAVINVCDAVSLNTLQTVNAYVQLNKIGTSTQPIVYQSNVFAGCTRGAKITFVGDIASSAIVMAGHYTTLQGFELTGATTNVIGAYGDKEQILYNNIHDITSTATCPATGAIQQVQAFDINPGLGVTHSDLGFTVRGNIIANVNPAGGRNVNCSEYHAIYSKFPSSTIQDNLIFNEGGGWGIQLFGYGCYDVITNNTVWGAEKGGIVFSHGDWSNDSLAVNQCPGGGKPENFITFNNNILAKRNPATQQERLGDYDFGSCAAGPGPYGTSNLISNNQAEFNVGTDGLTDTCNPSTGLTYANPVAADASAAGTFLNYQANGSGTYSLASGSNDVQAGTTSCAPTQSNCVATTDLLQNSWRPPNYDARAYRF